MRFASSAVLVFTITLVLGSVSHGQPPPYELRTMLLDPAVSTDETRQFGMSKLRGPYLCPHCGYSSMLPGDCPNPFGWAGHPAGTSLLLAARLQDQVLDLARAVGAGVATTSDIRYRDTSTAATDAGYNDPNRFRSLIGRPFHPTRVSEAPGSNSVFAQFAWPNRPAGWTNARAHFVTIPPGVKEPQVWYEDFNATRHGNAPAAPAGLYHDAALYREAWAAGDTYAVGARVSHGAPYRGYECILAHTAAADNMPGAGPNWTTYWQIRDLCEIRLNPQRVAEGDTYYIRYFSQGFVFLGTDMRTWRLVIYSRLYGLEFDSGLVDQGELHPDSTGYFRIVTASGALRLAMAIKADPNLINFFNANWQVQFNTRSSAVTSPTPTRGAPAEGIGEERSEWAWADAPMWQQRGAYYQFTPATDIISNTQPITGSVLDPSPVVPYNIKPGEIGTGSVNMRWRSEAELFAGGVPAAVTYRDNTETDEFGGNITVRTFYYEGNAYEWRYDTSTGFPASGPLNSDLSFWPPQPSFTRNYDPLESRFLVSRYQVPTTGDSNRHGPVEANPGMGGDSGYARIVAGRQTGGGDRLVLPGETATRRDALRVRNLVTQGDVYFRCPACGATFLEAQDRGEGWQHPGPYTAWALNTVYYPGDFVSHGGTNYLCIREHVGSGDTQPGGAGPNWSDYWEASPECYPEDRGWGVCPFHGDHSRNRDGSGPAGTNPVYFAPGPRVGLERIVPRTKRVLDQVIRSLTVPEVGVDAGGNPVPWLAAFPTLRPHLPDETLQITRQGQPVPPGADNYPGIERTISVRVPPYQQASEAGQEPGNVDLVNSAGAATPDGLPERNWGYRGGAVTFQETAARVTRYEASVATTAWASGTNYSVGDEVIYNGRSYRCTRAHRSNNGRRPDRPGGARFWTSDARWRLETTSTMYDENERWDTYFSCPDCGQPYSLGLPGVAPGNLLQCRNPGCPGHEWSPITGAKYPLGTLRCPFTGVDLQETNPQPDGSGDPNFGFRHLAAEEFAPYDVEAAVLKRTELVAEAQPADGGRMGPGVAVDNPDRTVAAAGGTPAGRRPDPADTSYLGRTAIRNEGNTIPTVTPVLDPLYRLFRPEAHQGLAGQGGRGYGWAGARDPIAHGLTRQYFSDTSVPLSGTWQLASAPAGAGSGTAAGLMSQVGGAGTALGAGQALGRYSGPLVYYMDTNGNGVFDFQTFTGQALNSAVALFDPERHIALEPYIITHARVRVSEAPFPHNSYLARDAAATPRVDYNDAGDPIRLQVMWMTNRNLADPSATPPTDAPMNLVYTSATPTGVGEAQEYAWDTTIQPYNLTTDTGPLAQNGPVDVYANGVGAGFNLFALWHSTHRGAGGLTSALRSSITRVGMPEPMWPPSGPNDYLWTGQERAEGVRGFFDADVGGGGTMPLHWAMWHSGQRGQERIMYAAWQPDGGAPGGKRIVHGGVLPVGNTILPTDPDDTVETLRDDDGIGPQAAQAVTIRRYPQGPFSAVKDVSPLLYLPPVLYDPSGGGSVTQPQLRVFFAGQARHLGNYDIYEVRFNRADLLNGDNNNGKLEFPRVRSQVGEDLPEGLPPMNPSVTEAPDPGPGVSPGEEFTADERRQTFHSRHLDWMTGTNFVDDGSMVTLILGVRLQGVPRAVHYYTVSWGPASQARGEGYDRRRGVYTVIPRFERYDEEFDHLPVWPNGPAGPVGTVMPFELVEPETIQPGTPVRPIKMEIDPVLGRVRFSAPLFDPGNPANASAVLNSSYFSELRNPDGSSRVEDVFLCGDYSPFVWRHTLSPANDDTPTAIMMRGPWHGNQGASVHSYPWPQHSHNQGVMLFWRRTFGSGQAPYHGRTTYMMKQESWTVRTNHVPVLDNGSLVVRTPGASDPFPELIGPGMPAEVTTQITDADYPNLPDGWNGSTRNEFDVDYVNGEIAVWRGAYRWVEYPNGAHRRSLIRSVRVQYQYPYVDEDGDVQTGTADETHRMGGWSQETVLPIDTVLSEGPLRVAEETYRTPAMPAPNSPFTVGRRYWVFWTSPRATYDLRLAAQGGSVVRQASGIYYCTVAPEFPVLLEQRRPSSNARNRFRPPF